MELTIDKIREQNYKLTEMEVKSYLPLPLKQLIVKNILAICTVEDSNLKKVDYSLKDFAFEMTLINQYTNVVCNTVNVYDELKSYNLIESIIKQIPESEVAFFANVLDKQIEQLHLVDNSFQMIVAKALEKLPDSKSLAKLISSLPKQINKIDPSKLKYLSDAIGWNNGIKKEA